MTRYDNDHFLEELKKLFQKPKLGGSQSVAITMKSCMLLLFIYELSLISLFQTMDEQSQFQPSLQMPINLLQSNCACSEPNVGAKRSVQL